MTDLRELSVLISGAGVAGPALAHWLARYGAAVTVVERAPGPRPGGQAIDFKGPVHDEVLRRTGIRDEVYRRQTPRGGEDVVVDAGGRRIADVPGDIVAGDVEILRGDLAEILHDHTRDRVEYVFGDTVTALDETTVGVRVTFAHSAPRTVDLVVGADGVHSRVRALAFGPEAGFVADSGYHYALVDLDVPAPARGELYSEPGRSVGLGGTGAPVLFAFRAPGLTYDRYDAAAQRAVIAAAFAGAGWRVPELLAALPSARSVYLDSISRVRVDRWSAGRVVLLGDAGYGATLGGFGTGHALVGAYVLAGELLVAGGDHRVAFARYEELVRPYVDGAESTSPGAFLAPATRTGLWLRNRLLRSAWVVRAAMRWADRAASSIALRDYPALADSGRGPV